MTENGVTRGIDWLLDPRQLPVRLLVLLASAVGCLLFLTDAPTTTDWALAVAAVLVTAGSARLPLATALAATGVLMLGFTIGEIGPVVPKVAAALALAELAARRWGGSAVLGGFALAAAYLLHTEGGPAATVYRATVMALLPVLLGAVLRTTRESAARARREAAELAHRRETEVVAARATERAAIARELHDLIAHHISSTVLRVGVARHALTSAPPAVLEVLDDIHRSGKETLHDLRTLVTVLRDPGAGAASFVDPAGLPVAITAVVERTRLVVPRIDLELDPDISTVDALTGLTLLRLAQEGTANVVKHAGPETTARLSITAGPDPVEFRLSDSGPATGTAQLAPPGSGMGLIGLRERVGLLGGTLTAEPAGSGWLLTASLPGEPGGAA
ncbi:histidine kinase [Nocardia rhamnosiphila]|uniref:sensor histidine kinase n=1 Tax=Nocardia rhamnosiphila TaxID=426716 RepID=UPI0033DA618A